MSEHKTEVHVKAKASGFKEVQQQAGKLVDAATKAAANQAKGYSGMKKSAEVYRKELDLMEKQLKRLERQQYATVKAMEGMAKGSKVYKALHEQFKNLNAESSRFNVQMRLFKSIYKPDDPPPVKPLTAHDLARGGFTQGFAHSMGIDLQRGPGMWRQAAGSAVGTAVRGMAGAPFGGVSGMVQGLSSLGPPGAFAAGQFQNMMGFAEGALGVQHSRLGMAAFMGGGVVGRGTRARARARAGVDPLKFDANWSPGTDNGFAGTTEIFDKGDQAAKASVDSDTDSGAMGFLGRGLKQFGKIIEKAAIAGAAGILAGPLGALAGPSLALVAGEKQAEKGMDAPGAQSQDARFEAMAKAMEPEEAYEKARDQAGRQAERAEYARQFQAIRGAGHTYGGKSEAEAIAAVQSTLQVGGGGMAGLEKSGMLPQLFAAQTKYGLGADVSGAFLQSSRSGGLAGGDAQNGAEQMTKVMQDAFRMGLEGSEMQDYMAQAAQAIQGWKTTGIPFNRTSIAQLGLTIAEKTGLGGVRSAAIAGGLSQASQGISERGVQDPIDMLMFRVKTGFKGGGMRAYNDAMIENEQKALTPEMMQEIVGKLVSSTGGRDQAEESIHRAFNARGIRIGRLETRAFVKQSTREPLDEKEAASLAKWHDQQDQAMLQSPKDAADAQAKAADTLGKYAPNVGRAAGIQNMQNATGENALDTMQNLQSSQAKVTKVFESLAGPGFKKLSEYIDGGATALSGFKLSVESATTALKNVVDILGL